MSSLNCAEFRPHHLRPDKCRSCFGDKSSHPQQQNKPPSWPATSEQQSQTRISEVAGVNDLATGQSGKSSVPNVNDMTRDQLVSEFKRCHEERVRLHEANQQIKSVAKERSEQVESCKSEIEKLREELNAAQAKGGTTLQSPEQSSNVADKCAKCGPNLAELYRLRSDVEQLRGRCESAEAEREQAKDELKSLEREMEEMHDNFKEEESEQFEQLKQELDLAMKNCKILQIRLNKAERQYGQLEQVKVMLEQQLEETTASSRFSQHQQQQSSRVDSNQPATFAQIGPDSIKLSTSEYDQLLRDLNDTIERERDLQEQIKYSQEEAQMKGDRLQAVETENEVLLSKVNKLTLTNSRLRSASSMRGSMEGSDSGTSSVSTTATAPSSSSSSSSSPASTTTVVKDSGARSETCDLMQQNEQLKLALELAQSECERLKTKCQDSLNLLENKESSWKESETKRAKLEEELVRARALRRPSLVDDGDASKAAGELTARLELECRQLRTRLVHSERNCKQLKAQLEMIAGGQRGGKSSSSSATGQSNAARLTANSSSPGEQAKYMEINRQLREQCESLKAHNSELEKKIELLSTNQNVGQTMMESDLLGKLKHQLDVSESELAKTKSRLVELDLECSRSQRQYKRLIEAIENGNDPQLGRRVHLPPESMRDAMSRQDLRQSIKELENELEECINVIKSKDCLLRELSASRGEHDDQRMESASNVEEQVKSLRRLLEQERLLSSNLKIDVGNLERAKSELQANNRMLERERLSIAEEVDKLRQVNAELNMNLEEAKEQHQSVSARIKELQVNNEKLRVELDQLRSSSGGGLGGRGSKQQDSQQSEGRPGGGGQSADLLLLARDLSELKVKNGFLMRQLEIAREEASRQLDEVRQSNEAQQKRAVELAQIELREQHLIESQQLRNELNELKQKVAAYQRQLTRSEEEAATEKDRLRSMERDWRRDKSHWQQRLEQLESQLTIEHRSHEFKAKEWESLLREKERESIGVQDKCVQLERDLKRMHNKYNLLEENSESKQKNLTRDLETKKHELSELMARNQAREDEYYENCKRFNSEKATLLEAFESIKRSYDEKLAELKSTKELLSLRQDQAYKERLSAQDRIDNLNSQLNRMSEHETQVHLLREQLQIQAKQLEQVKRDYIQIKEERLKLKGRCDDFERRCLQYEKQELITKTTSISSSTNLFFKSGKQNATPVGSTPDKKSSDGPGWLSSRSKQQQQQQREQQQQEQQRQEQQSQQQQLEASKEQADRRDQFAMIEKLSSKINDQRHLINMLKQQLAESQIEIKQMKLVHSAEKNKFQARITQLTSQLNECEERLLFESSLVSRDTFESSRRKFEVKWAQERQATLDMVQQQQSQNESLMRDLKKISQAHDLLRLHTKQLESHNNKLSRKIIEYQQRLPAPEATMISSATNGNNASRLSQELQVCQSERRQLARLNTRLTSVLREEARPLVTTLTKIVAALDTGDQASTSSKRGSSDSAEPKGSSGGEAGSNKSNSTYRPLMTSSARQHSADDEASIAPVGPVSSQSRLSRLLGKQPKQQHDQDGNTSPKTISQQAKSLKRVRIKSASLGITISEKRQLKQHLQELRLALDQLGTAGESGRGHVDAAPLVSFDSSEWPAADRHQERASSETVDERRLLAASGSSATTRRGSFTPTTRATATNSIPYHSQGSSRSRQMDGASRESPQSRVHWRLDSDIESDRSLSASLLDSGAPLIPNQQQQSRADLYKRFPQTTSGGYTAGASLTDYESESSLASELSSSYSRGPRFISGTESDSCVQATGNKLMVPSASSLASKKHRGIKTRLTSTLRNISRSIGGLASDSECESTSRTIKPLRSTRGGSSSEAKDGQAGAAKSGAGGASTSKDRLREIRV